MARPAVGVVVPVWLDRRTGRPMECLGIETTHLRFCLGERDGGEGSKLVQCTVHNRSFLKTD